MEQMAKIDVYALAQQDIHVLEEMIADNPKITTTKDQSDRLLLHWAALGGRDQLLEILLSRPDAPDIDIVDDIGATPLILSSLKGSLACVKLLLARGANVNARNNQGHSSIQYACSKGHQDVVEFLLAQGADPNIADNRGDTPLHRLATLGRIEILKKLCEWKEGKLEMNPTNKEGNTPLHIACEDGQIQVAMMLVENGARVDVKNKEEQTPLDLCKPGLRRQIKEKLGLSNE